MLRQQPHDPIRIGRREQRIEKLPLACALLRSHDESRPDGSLPWRSRGPLRPRLSDFLLLTYVPDHALGIVVADDAAEEPAEVGGGLVRTAGGGEVEPGEGDDVAPLFDSRQGSVLRPGFLGALPV